MSLGQAKSQVVANWPFWVWPLRVELRALEAIYFPPGKAANVLRGAFGMAIERAAPELRSVIFAPKRSEDSRLSASGFADPPRPFVLRARELDGQRFAAGEAFQFQLHLLLAPERHEMELRSVLEQLAAAGLGPTHGKAKLTAIRQSPIACEPIPGGGGPFTAMSDAGVNDRLLMEFLSPTEIKAQGRPVTEPTFSVLFRRLQERLSNLSKLYQDGATPATSDELLELSERVTTSRSGLRTLQVERFSTRTGQSHSLGGFVGQVEFCASKEAGGFAPFWPYLQAGSYVGVGRQTVWGKGEYTARVHRA